MLVKKWIIHSLAQNIINLLPNKLSYKVYFWVQLKFGRVNKKEAISYLTTSLSVKRYCDNHERKDKSILELGTGRTITTLIGLWILGFDKMITIDLNPYLSEELTRKDINNILANSNEIFELYKNDLGKEEFDTKISLLSALKDQEFAEILKSLSIQYYPYQDARKLDFVETSSVGIYFSNQVLEHISYDILKGIFQEGKRVLVENGLFIHFIGLHDHFATIDSSISKINFLKYSNFKWNILAGNKFMYHNRLRSTDYLELFERYQYPIVKMDTLVDSRSLDLLENGFKLNPQFEKYKKEDLATFDCKIVSENFLHK